MTADECFLCGGPPDHLHGNGYLCGDCRDRLEAGRAESEDDTSDADPSASTPEGDDWSAARFDAPESRVWPPELLEREQWMGHVDKKPFAPWSDRDHPEAAPDEDARWKWGLTENYVDGATVTIGEDDPRLDGRVFLQRESDPYAYVDGDDVRDPDTGDVHPAFIEILEQLGLTYADVSQSGAGVHANYRGDLPDGVKQAAWELDDVPWGANDETPSVEIYAGKRVCVATGEHVPGTPTAVREWDADALEDLLDANDQLPTEPARAPSERPDLTGYEPTATTASETTSDIRDVFAALDRLDARRVAEQTIVHAWNDTASTSDGKRAFAPTWGPSANGTANVVDDQIWQDTGDEAGYGGPVVMALIDAGELSHRNVSPRDARGQLWFRGLEHLRDLGFDIPQYRPSPESGDETGDAAPVSGLPLAQLDHMAPDERRRAARRRGLKWPTTEEARDRLFDTIGDVMRHGDDRVVDAPTALGKSYTVASTRWGAREDLTGGRPVVHLLELRDARDEAIEVADEHGGDYFVLRSRDEACPVAAGDYDPPADDGVDVDYQPITMDGEPASAWISMQCDGKDVPFSAAHRRLHAHNDQGIELPCTHGGECPAIQQWTEYREGDHPLVIATHNFAHVPGLRTNTNVVLDEAVDFARDLTTERVRTAVTAYLREIDAPVSTWEEFITIARATSGDGSVSLTDYQDLRDALNEDPDREWYFEHPDAHMLAPALARALLHAETRGNGRRVGKTPYEPPRLDANARDDDGWNREWLTVVLTDDNEIARVRSTPDFELARSVTGLDAHPSLPLWQANTLPHIQTKAVLEPEERQLWRRYERGLRVVQVGDATRPLTGGEYFDAAGARVLVEHLREEYGDDFRTAITANSVEDQLARIMQNAGCGDVETMHYGAEKSRNDFADEPIGLVNGVIDPGDDYVLDLLAELGLNAEPVIVDCGHCDGTGECDGECDHDRCSRHDETCRACKGSGEQREKGRTFEGPDADTASEILASVRENHTAQAAGRYARNPDDPGSTATVFVRTDAMPPGFADIQTPGVVWRFTNKQEQIIRALREATGQVTARDLAMRTGVSKRHVHRTLKRLVEDDIVAALEGHGPNGATLYSDTGTPHSGVADLTGERGEVVTAPVWGSYTWSVAIRAPTRSTDASQELDAATPNDPAGEWVWETADPGGGGD